MKRYTVILKDAVILLIVSTIFVTLCGRFFKALKKTSEVNPLVTAVLQGDIKGAGELLGEKGFQSSSGGYPDAASYASSLANAADELGRTPLMWAAYANFNSGERLAETDKKRAEFTELLLRSGAEAGARDKDGWTALMWASWSGLPLVAQRTAAAGAPLAAADAQGNTALMLAAMRGNADIVRFLAAKEADKGAVNKAGKRAADLAAENLARYPKKAADYREIIGLLGV